MANNPSAEKRIRQTEVRTDRNRAVKSRIRTLRKKVLSAVTSGDKAAAATVPRSNSNSNFISQMNQPKAGRRVRGAWKVKVKGAC
jgi:ribosomal protein S20